MCNNEVKIKMTGAQDRCTRALRDLHLLDLRSRSSPERKIKN